MKVVCIKKYNGKAYYTWLKVDLTIDKIYDVLDYDTQGGNYIIKDDTGYEKIYPKKLVYYTREISSKKIGETWDMKVICVKNFWGPFVEDLTIGKEYECSVVKHHSTRGGIVPFEKDEYDIHMTDKWLENNTEGKIITRYFIYNDRGNYLAYEPELFITVKELRNEKLEKLGI